MLAGQLASAVPAHAATFTVNSLLDDGDGGNTTLREAIASANSTPGADTINFSVTGDIQLTAGRLGIFDDVTITGPGPEQLTVHGDDDGGNVFYLYSNPPIVVTISGLTVTEGNGDFGGGISVFGSTLTLDDMVITENGADLGGGVAATSATLVITDSTISDNLAIRGGGVFSDSTILTITGTQFIHNSVDGDSDYGAGGGLAVGGEGGSASITGSVFDDNQAVVGAGIGLNARNTPVAIVNTTLTGNDAVFIGGGLAMDMSNDDPADLVTITDSTISGNTAANGGGGGIFFYGPYEASSRLRVDRSTISGNDGGEGGGVLIRNGFDFDDDQDVTHSVTVSDSTISGNRALGLDRPGPYYDLLAAGGGVFVALHDNDAYGGVDTLAVTLANSTIAGNTGAEGGGVYEHIFNDAVITLDHTIVGDNATTYLGPDILGSVNANWSLVENTGSTSLTGANNVTGVDPQLGPLANNGGPTETHMIAATSPAHNAGDPAFVPPPTVDQRGRPRVSGTRIDIGSVERQTSLPALIESSVNWRLRDRLSTGPANAGTFTFGSTPLVPIIGDWDGDGDETPGYVKGGVFTLSNNLDGSGPYVTFTFGDNRGFPVAGDWDGDGDDEVAVFRNGTWQVRANTNPGLVAPTTFIFGSGTWPATTPVAGDWDGDGTDGIGFYNGNGTGVGTWTLRQTATAAGTTLAPFNYEPSTPGYPVVGDWDGDGDDTVGVKSGATWYLRNTNSAGSAEITFAFSVNAPTELPLSWRLAEGP